MATKNTGKASKKLYKVEVKKQRSVRHTLKREAKQFQKEFAERLLKLVTSGFGLVSALAWNELIKEVIKTYVEPIFGKESGFISLLIYALAVTFLAVFVTYQLSKIIKGGDKED